jgi:cyclopropane fatty-acyl-phospholipid synthase-like methyltransferase
VDYSAASIEIAKGCLKNADSSISNRVSFHLGSATELQYNRTFDLVVAADIIEHLSTGELDRLYQTITKALTQDGVLIIHTAPNAWFYKKGYNRRKKLVEKMGGYMPAEPRTRYELLLHINEQSPAKLKRQLAKFFLL